MIMTASKLRKDIYNVLDQVLETGVPAEIQRRGKTLKIILPNGKNKLANLKKHDCLVDDPQSIVHMDWSHLWKS